MGEVRGIRKMRKGEMMRAAIGKVRGNNRRKKEEEWR